MISDPERLRRLLGGPAWAWWRQRAWGALASGQRLPATLTQARPSPAEREAANRLLGTPGVIGPIRIRHADFAALLTQAGIADDLVACLIELEGPLPQPDTATPRWLVVLAQAGSRLAPLVDASRLAQLLDAGGLKRLAGGDPEIGATLVGDVVLVLRQLGQPRLLAQLAVAATGDAHALDRDRALGRLAARLLGANEDARSWRAAWAAAGVATDELSPTALSLNLRFAGDGPLARIAACAAVEGEPLRLTARQLRDRSQLHLPGGRLLVCENPAIVALAAGRLGPRCPPLIASEGWPTLAVLDLIDRAVEARCEILVHADLDWAGLAIAADLLTRPGARPWRLGAADVTQHAALPGPVLVGLPVATPWDVGLADALAARGRALHEEAVAEALLADAEAWSCPAIAG